jgi:radical SAM-linked protein
MTAIFDRHSVELARGCTEGCRFCQAGMIYRPVRERRPEDVIASVISGVQKGGFDEASLTCLSTADYSAITPLLLELLDKMKENHATLGISSLRAYGLDKRIFDKMAEVKNSSLTFAPEAGTDRMRKVINKNITEKDMMNTAYDVFQRGWHKMKLYFMIGLPTETDEDVKAIMETGFKAREVARKCGVRSPSITISASSFVPKPHTPFQWCAMISYSEIERKQEMLWGLSKAYKLNFRKHLSKTSAMECLIARGDRSIAPVIYSAWKKGARFDGWNETFSFSLWMEAIEEHDVDLAKYLGTIRLDGRLPWDHIDVGLEEKFLVREWKKALKDRLSPPCGKPAGAIIHHSTLDALVKTHEVERKRLVCYACGVACDLEGMIEERKEYLTSLKSFSEIPYVEPENMGLDISKRREKRQQNIGFKYRLEFTKIGSISFISHLDLQKVMARIFKRLGVQVLYSEGYNPRPLFSFGPALSLGISSLSEWFDIRVEEKFIDLEKMLQNLNQQSEKGIIFHSMVEVEKKALSIQEAITAYQYFIPVDDLKEHEVFMHFKNSEVLAIESLDRKTGDKMAVNLKNELLDITTGALDLAQSDWVDVIDEVSPCKGKKGYFVTARSTQGRTLKPRDIQSYFDQFGCQTYRPIKVGSKLSANISP